MENFKFINNLEELKDGDKYQIKVIGYTWTYWKEYDSNICNSKKEYLRELIRQKRLRVLIK